MENIKTIEELIEYINSLEGDPRLEFRSVDFREKSKQLAKDEKEHGKVLNCLLNKMVAYYESGSCRYLPATRQTLLKFTAWTWF